MKILKYTIVLLLSLQLNAQNKDICYIFSSPDAIFYGVDFSLVKFRNDGAAGFNDLVKIRDSYFFTINSYFTPEVDKYNLNSHFNKNMTLSLETANKRSRSVDIDHIMVDYTYIANEEAITTLLSSYPTDNSKSNLGIIIIAEQLNKVKSGGDNSFGTYKLIFFKNSDHTILLSINLTGMSGGMGWANFWWKSISNALDDVKMNKLKKQYCPDSK
jgi:hypothetical protein